MAGNMGELTTSIQQAALQAQQAALQAQKMFVSPMVTNYTIQPVTLTTTGEEAGYSREYEMSRIVKRAKGGYFFVITVDATDDVFYRVWRGGLFPYVVAKLFKKFAPDVNGNRESWNLVPKRSHLPATLGAAYEKVEEVIKEDIEQLEHERYVKEILKTAPENLKMIGGLERLAEGPVDAPKADPNAGSSYTVGGHTYSNNIAVSGAGTIINHQPGNAIQFSNSDQPMNISCGGLDATKITINGTDLVQTLEEQLRDATAVIEEKLDAIIEDKAVLVNAP